jgi:hypothetical protein
LPAAPVPAAPAPAALISAVGAATGGGVASGDIINVSLGVPSYDLGSSTITASLPNTDALGGSSTIGASLPATSTSGADVIMNVGIAPIPEINPNATAAAPMANTGTLGGADANAGTMTYAEHMAMMNASANGGGATTMNVGTGAQTMAGMNMSAAGTSANAADSMISVGGGSQTGDYVPGTRFTLDANGNPVRVIDSTSTTSNGQVNANYANTAPNGGTPLPDLGPMPTKMVGTAGKYGYKNLILPTNTSLADIATKYGYDLRELVQVNGTNITAGQNILVPRSQAEFGSVAGFDSQMTQAAAAPAPAATVGGGPSTVSPTAGATYVWKTLPKGSTMADFAKKNGYDLAKLKELNGTNVQGGDQILVPAK